MTTAFQLLQQLLTMIDETDFNRCTMARNFKGHYDVWMLNHADDIMFLEHENDKTKEEPSVTEIVLPEVTPAPPLVHLDEFLKDSTDAP